MMQVHCNYVYLRLHFAVLAEKWLHPGKNAVMHLYLKCMF